MPTTAADAVFSLLDRELWLLTTSDGRRRAGLITTLVSQASIVPERPRVWVGLSPQHHTTDLLRETHGFLMHLVSAPHFELAYHFGSRSGHDGDKFTAGTWGVSRHGHPLVTDAVAWLECSVESYAETGDRIFFLARVDEARKLSDEPPLTLHQFLGRLTPAQTAAYNSHLTRDATVDADLIRRWHAAGYGPLALAPDHEIATPHR